MYTGVPHHLILIREIDEQMSGSGCCGRIEGDATLWSTDDCVFPERRDRMARVGEIYRAVRKAFGERVEITIIDPRNFISYLPLVARDAFRFRVPIGTALRAMASSSLSTAVLDGQLLFRNTLPSPDEVVSMVEARLEIDRVGIV
ncbi:MAG: hypothetical protein GEU90_04825 [Gemmatimonas sp.]|nr:hypothetical protein [Gemmatimonas sp.]